MAVISWDAPGERFYQTGISHGVLYPQIADGTYPLGVAWNGLTQITESPSGATATPLWADNMQYLNLMSAEQFGGTIDAFTYPDEWEPCDGSQLPATGVSVSQQTRQPFGLSYQTILGNDTEGNAFGTIIHLVWNATASPSDRAYATVNDTPAAITFSWTFTCLPVTLSSINPNLTPPAPYLPTAHMEINTREADPTALAALEAAIYGTASSEPYLPTPDDVIAMFTGTTP